MCTKAQTPPVDVNGCNFMNSKYWNILSISGHWNEFKICAEPGFELMIPALGQQSTYPISLFYFIYLFIVLHVDCFFVVVCSCSVLVVRYLAQHFFLNFFLLQSMLSSLSGRTEPWRPATIEARFPSNPNFQCIDHYDDSAPCPLVPLTRSLYRILAGIELINALKLSVVCWGHIYNYWYGFCSSWAATGNWQCQHGHIKTLGPFW